MTCLDTTRRQATLDEIERTRFDLVVVGGGITGAGVACEAARRGLSVALLEAGDYAGGTSSRSSKLIHGGLRYLAMGDVALVRETALERKVLHRMAPHLVQPRWMLLPVKSRAGLLKFRTGLATYEKLGAVEEPDLHQNLDAAALGDREPILDRERYPYACAYREYLTDDARLVLANLRAAVAAGALTVNRVAVAAISKNGRGVASGVEAHCRLSGRRLRVAARSIVNAAGPWVEHVQRFDEAYSQRRLHLSKGVHICFPLHKVPVRNLLLLAAADRRTIFAIPRGCVAYVGTTDTTYTGEARTWPEINQADVDYLIEPLRRYCPSAQVEAGDVDFAWAGLRPLVAQAGRAAKDVSRKDEITVSSSGVVSVAGGKLTGYRPMACRILDRLTQSVAEASADAREEVLPGGDLRASLEDCAQHLAGEFSLAPCAARRLVDLYGSEAVDVLALGAQDLGEGAIVSGEIEWAVRREGATSVEDVLYRRTRTAFYEPQAAEKVAEVVAKRMGELLAWNDRQRAEQAEGWNRQTE